MSDLKDKLKKEYSPIDTTNKPVFKLDLTIEERNGLINSFEVYVEDKSFSATADELGYSNATIVRDMHESALKKFRIHAQGDIKC